MVLTLKQKGILSIIGSVIYHMGSGVIFLVGSYNIYIISYINSFHKDDPYQLFYGYFIMPTMIIGLAGFGPLGGIFDYKLGCHLTMIISTFGLLIAILILYFATNISMIYGGMIVLGFGGIGLTSANKNVCFFFPQKRGTLLSLMGAISSLGMGFFNFYGESLINPNNTQLKQKELYYDYSVSKNILKLYIIMALYILTTTIISLLFTFKFDPKSQVNDENLMKEIQNSTSAVGEDNKSETTSNSNSTSNSNQNNNTNTNLTQKNKGETNKAKSNYSSDLKKAFRSKRLWHLCLLYFLTTFLYFLISVTFKVIGTLQKFNVVVLKLAGVISGLQMSFAKPIWGVLFDRFGFKSLILIYNITGLFLGVLMCVSLHQEIFFAFLMCLSSTIMAGFTSIVGPHVMKIFSLKYSTEIGGAIIISMSLSNVLASIFAFCVSNFVSNMKIAFYMAYIVGALLNLISLVLVKYETNQPFVYDDNHMVELTETNDSFSLEKGIKTLNVEKLDTYDSNDNKTY